MAKGLQYRTLRATSAHKQAHTRFSREEPLSQKARLLGYNEELVGSSRKNGNESTLTSRLTVGLINSRLLWHHMYSQSIALVAKAFTLNQMLWRVLLINCSGGKSVYSQSIALAAKAHHVANSSPTLTDDEGITERHGHVVRGHVALGQESQVSSGLCANLQGRRQKKKCHAFLRKHETSGQESQVGT